MRDFRFLLAALFFATRLASQSCPLPPVLHPLSQSQNIFTDQQESDLGDILADSLVEDEAVIDDDALSAHLRNVAAQLVRYLPENHFRIQFFLIELPEANAFSLPGGRVYISRKLIASLKSDAELAAILAHELGHVITHQGAIEMTASFRQVLGVNSVTDQRDIADKIHRVQETWAMHKLHVRDTEVAGELGADQVSLYAMARAGFNLQAFPDALDRTADLHGRTGNWITDLFHTTKPEQKRLREAIREIGTISTACIAPSSPTADSAFKDWQLQVIAYKQPGGHEHLSGVVFREKLAQPLRPNLSNIRFSRDGKYILAQDEGGIHVLSHDPFKSLFFIEASGTYKASFTPDSKYIVFYTPELRIETWDIRSQQRVLVREMVLNTSCIQTALSPDGKSLACYDTNATLWLFDTATGNPIIEHRNFFRPTALGLLMIELGESAALSSDSTNSVLFVNLGFSPDGQYLVAGGNRLAGDGGKTIVYDLFSKKEIPVGVGVRDAGKGPFVFVGNDQIAALNVRFPTKSSVVQFPSGKKNSEIALALGTELISCTTGDYIFAGPVPNAALTLLDLKNKVSLARLKFDAADVYNGVVLFEQLDGTLALIDLTSKKIVAALTLQESRLSSGSAIAVSPDFKWLAASTKTRGATWDLTTNNRTHSLRGFHGGWFAAGRSFYADFPKFGDQERSIVKLDLTTNAFQTSASLAKLNAKQLGHYILVTTSENKNSGDRHWTYELRDFLANSATWSRKFDREFPASRWDTDSGKVLFWWAGWESAAKDEMKHFSGYNSADEKANYFFEVVDLKSNNIITKFPLDTHKGSFRITDAAFDGDWLAVTTKEERVIIYSLLSGKEIGHVFGYSPTLSAESKTLVVPLSETILNVYDLSTTEFRARLKFGAPVIYRAFSADGKRIFVLTSDQTAYILDLSAAPSLAPTLAQDTKSRSE